jgi:UDP-N-acetylmuramoyl-tripeptide--D-alanyl-D-alanine ligase
MLRGALGTRWAVHATEENRNNLIGVPLTILEAPVECDALVVEAGANLPGEIGRLRDIIEPTLGLVTNVGAGHLEGFGSLEGVLAEKVSLLEGVETAVVGTEPCSLAECALARGRRVVTAGLAASADLRPDEWGVDERGRGWFRYGGTLVQLQLLGRHQIENAMLVVAVASELGLEIGQVGPTLESQSLPYGRCELVADGQRLVLHDAYNANPGSLLALLDTASTIRGGRKLVVVLGTMLELGAQSEQLHARMADAVMKADPHIVAVIGEFVPAFERHADALGDNLVTAPDPESLGRALADLLQGELIVIVKGSHGVHLERAVPHIVSGDPNHEMPCSTIS